MGDGKRDVERPEDPGAWVNLAVAVRACPAPPGRSSGSPHRPRRSTRVRPSSARDGPTRSGSLESPSNSGSERAEALFRQALGAEGGEQIARLHLGELLARSGRTAEGIAEFGGRRRPNHATLRNNLATALFIVERLEDAVGTIGSRSD